MTFKEYLECEPNTDYAKVAYEFRAALLRLANQANHTLRTWDGHHRLALEVARAHTTVANERIIGRADYVPGEHRI